MNPNQTAPMEQAHLGPYCLQYRLPKNISRQEEQMTKVVTDGLRFKYYLSEKKPDANSVDLDGKLVPSQFTLFSIAAILRRHHCLVSLSKTH